MKLIKFFIISVVSLQSFSTELSIGSIEEIYLKSGTNERRIQIYYPYSKNVNNKTKFIIMNDGEELFSENDSWNGKAWNIDETFKDLKTQKENLNLVIIAIDSAKRINGNILDETRRYAEYFPKESIKYIDGNLTLLKNIEKDKINNIQLHNGNVYDVLENLNKKYFTLVWIFFPDPWPKNRHAKRRLITSDFLMKLHNILKDNSEIHIATDSTIYVLSLIHI